MTEVEERPATKSDIDELKGDIDKLRSQLRRGVGTLAALILVLILVRFFFLALSAL
ncbi:MAG: hypothetical protein OXH85_06000 [Truepera sp.]|nr:hypothetical protein [Truepera sp.]